MQAALAYQAGWMRRHGVGCPCVNPDDLNEAQKLAAGIAAPVKAGVGAGAEALIPTVLIFGAGIGVGALLGAVVGGPEHTKAGVIVGGALGAAVTFVGALVSASKGMT